MRLPTSGVAQHKRVVRGFQRKSFPQINIKSNFLRHVPTCLGFSFCQNLAHHMGNHTVAQSFLNGTVSLGDVLLLVSRCKQHGVALKDAMHGSFINADGFFKFNDASTLAILALLCYKAETCYR